MGAKNSKKNSAIEQKINGVNIEDIKQTQSVVILGTSNSGKSTVFKALQWNDPDLEQWQSPHYVDAIRRFCLQQTDITLDKIQKCDMDETFKDQLTVRKQTHDLNIDKLQTLLIYFWSQNIMKQTFEENSMNSNQDSWIVVGEWNIMNYFVNKIDAIFSVGYKPSKQDILRVHIRTTGFRDFEKSVHGRKYRFCDIGGRRSERSKLLVFCFKKCRFAIYVCGLNQYAQTWEDCTSKTLMQDSLELFNKIVNFKNQNKMQIILLLNKTDLFKECIQKISLNAFYDDYNGVDYEDFTKSNIFKAIIKSYEKNLNICIPDNIGMLIGEYCVFLTCQYWIDLNYKNGIEYIKQRYLKCSNSTTRIITYETCALNPDQIESVIHDAVAQIERNCELGEMQQNV